MGINKRDAKKVIPLLQTLKKLHVQDRKNVLQYLNDEACQKICECIANSLANDSVPRKKRQKLRRALSSDKVLYNYLAGPKNSIKRRQKLLPQTGQGLGLILSIAIPLLLALIK